MENKNWLVKNKKIIAKEYLFFLKVFGLNILFWNVPFAILGEIEKYWNLLFDNFSKWFFINSIIYLFSLFIRSIRWAIKQNSKKNNF